MPYARYLASLHRMPLACLAVAMVLCVIFASLARQPEPVTSRTLSPVRLAQAHPTHSSLSAQLLAQLPSNETGLPELLHVQADATNVALDEVSYQRDQEPALPVWRLHATFTLQDSYVQIRRYVDQVLRAGRNVALESIDCARDDIASDDVNCAIKLVAYARTGSDPAAESPHGR